jgi:PhzF family phenazine biosynthesis protein
METYLTMPLPLFHVDAFAERPFSGNPAAVCILEEPAEEAWMQSVAAEMNLSETAFLLPSGPYFELRWFTPTTEVDLCGHATLASAHVLWSEGRVSEQQTIEFHSKSGLLTATRRGDRIELDFPLEPAQEVEIDSNLEAALGAAAEWMGRNRMDCLVEVESEGELLQLEPDFVALEQLDVRGVIVTALADTDEYDFVSRFFAPAAGVDEDPVTGSAHCCLADFWQKRLGKSEMVAFQVSKRGGRVYVRVRGDRVVLGGNAVTVAAGVLR